MENLQGKCSATLSLLMLFSVAHHIYGVAHTINSANYVYFLGLQKALTLQHPEVTRVFTGNSFIAYIHLVYSKPAIYGHLPCKATLSFM